MIETELIVRDKHSGKLNAYEVQIAQQNDRLWFVKAPFALKDEIKAMKGSKWDADNRVWSVDDCQRNHFQLSFLEGKKPYSWFDRPLIQHQYSRPLMPHQCDLADRGLTYHYQLLGCRNGHGQNARCSRSYRAQLEAVVVLDWTEVLNPNIKREFKKWDFDSDIQVDFYTYDALIDLMDYWQPGSPVPFGLLGDESSKCKTATSQRSKAMQRCADLIRDTHGMEGYTILMSGTPSPKSPVDWWSQAEIVWPGFLREGSPKALENRVAFMSKKNFESTGPVNTRDSWRDDERKCNLCGQYENHNNHDEFDNPDAHLWEPSKNEVAFMHNRLKGLVVIKHKKDCLNLPDKRYRVVHCKSSGPVTRLAKMIVDGQESNAMQTLTLLRELSDGFQYRDVKDGKSKCSHCENGKVFEWRDPQYEDRNYQSVDILDPEVVARLERYEVECPVCLGTQEMDRIVRETKILPCPKDDALREILEENEETARIVIFAGFTGSVDRVVGLCHREKWNVVRCDGRGFAAIDYDGNPIEEEPLDYWEQHNGRVAFVAHPESGGMSLTLTAARTAVYWSNSFKPEYRIQSEDRIHRKGMDENLGCEIIDLIHLSTDERVLEVIRENRKLELMTMGEIKEWLNEEAE